MSLQEEPEQTSVAAARDLLEREAAAARTEQLERALSRLTDEGELTAAQRAAVERLSERLVEGVLAGPRAQLGDPANRTDGDGCRCVSVTAAPGPARPDNTNPDEAARTVLELFD